VLTYKSFSFHIFEDKNEFFQCEESLSTFEINHLVKVLLWEVQKYFLWDEEKCLTSPLYRISKLSGFDYFAKFEHVLKIPVYSQDMRSIAEEFLNMKPISHRKAVVYGVPFKGRGINCRETELPSDIRYGAQSNNKTRKHCLKWFDKKEYSSWCRFAQKSKPNSQNLPRYGQINAFFKLNISDPVLNGLLIASITAYKFGASEGVETVNYNGSLDATKLFVSLQDIQPTQVATIPFTADHFALSKRFSGVYRNFVKYFEKSSALAYYVMLIMQPENLSLYPDFRPLFLQKNS
jgi:hypothetical protein